MPYTTSFRTQFAVEFKNFPRDQQDKILDFTDIFETHGLSDFTKYVGKISPSWSGSATPAAQAFAKANDLWHYHIGLPGYTQVHSKFKTSDWVLHFQWINRGDHIDLVDLYSHYRADGTFYLPGIKALT